MKEITKSASVFIFNHITKEDVMKEVRDLDVSKASQENDIPTKIINESADIFPNFKYESFNNMIDVCIFPTSVKLANVASVSSKKGQQIQRKIIDL